MVLDPQIHQSNTSDTKKYRKIVSDCAELFIQLARKCDVSKAAVRIKKAKSDFDTQRFSIVLASGKPRVGKTKLICGLLDEPNLLPSEDTTLPFKIRHSSELGLYEQLKDLSNLLERGYDELAVPVSAEPEQLSIASKLVDETTTLKGKLVDETAQTVTLTFTCQLKLPKSPPSTVVTYDDEKKETVGWVESENPNKIVLKKIDGTTVEHDALDIKEIAATNFLGKRKQKYTVRFKPKPGKQSLQKQIDPKDVNSYMTEDDAKYIEIEIDNPFLRENPEVELVETPYFGRLIKDEERAVCLLNARAFLFLVDGVITEEEKEALASLRTITDKIYFVQTKIDLVPDGWKQQRQRNLEIISELTGGPSRDIEYFAVSTKWKEDQDPTKKEKSECSRFPHLLKFLQGKLDITNAEEINKLSIDFLQELKFDTETLILRVGLNTEELLEFEGWFNDTYQPLRTTFEDKSEQIIFETEELITQTFNRWVILKTMETLGDKSAAYLKSNLHNIQRNFILECAKRSQHVLDFFIRRMDELCTETADQMRQPWKNRVESPASKLSMYFVKQLSQNPGAWGETLQSAMYPLLIASGALQTLLTGSAVSGPPGWLVGGAALLAFLLFGASRYFKRQEAQIIEKNKTHDELKQIFQSIMEHVSGEVNQKIKKLIFEYKIEAKRAFEVFEKDAESIISSSSGNPISKSQEMQNLNSQAAKLLEKIDKTLTELEASVQ